MRLLTLLFALLAATGYSQIEYQPLFCHLMEVNQEWDQMNADSEDLEKEMSFENDVERIQMHLRLVEKHLRAKDVSLLNELQRNNREKCLDVLRKYASDVVFPQNRYHKERIPYFIDHRGVHCAVGHLIMSTGYGDFAQQVHKENNYLYLGELQEIYPEIEFWAEENGFTPKELAWIQPGYSPCVTDCSEEMFIICSGGVGSEESYTYTWSNGETGFHIDNACPGQAISCIVLDSLGQEIPSNNCSMIAGESGLFVGTNSIVLPETSGAIMEITSIATDSDECTGEATVTVLNNVVTDTPQWESSGQSGSTATNLCEGWHYVTINSGVYETYECQTTDSIYISLSDQICEIHPGINNEYELPNPVNLRTFDLGETDALIESGTLLQYNDEDQTATLTAHFTSVADPSAGWDLELQLTNGMNWEEWSTQSFPTSYRDDTETVIDEYLAWKYYIVSCGTLSGWGNWEGSHLNLAQAPENHYYGFELGMNSNGWNSGFGAKVWLTGAGLFYNTETSVLEPVLGAQLSLYMDIDECAETTLEVETESCEPFLFGQTCEINPGINNEYELPNPVNLRTFDLGETDALIESGTLLQYNDEDQTATLTAHFTSVTDSSAGWDLELQLTSGMNWEEWSTQSFPTSYRDDTETVIDEYLAWKYYIVSCGTLNGWGNWEGSHLNLAHAPENNFYGFELGMNSNGWNSGFGAKVWLTATGQVYNTETSTIESVLAQLSLHMDIDECMETVIETEPENCEPFSAGSDIFMCDLCEWNTQLGAALPCSTTGEWSLIQGAGTFEDITNPNSFLELDGYGIHILEWSAECNDELLLDTVAVYLFADSFIPPNAGEDLFVNYCEGDSVQLNGEIPQPPLMAFWVQEDGCPVEFSNVDDPNSMVYGLLPGVYTFSWNLPISCSCPVYDQVTVTVTGCEGGIELCEPSLSGCTLPFATNYNPSAIEDTGNCEFDFSICDCLGNVHSPYAYLQLGDGIPNNAVNLDFNCELWGYDCGDIENTSNGDFEVCDGNLPAMYGCTDNVEERSSTGLNIYPNPTGGIMYITLQGFGNDINLEIYNSIGALVHKEHANSSHVRLDLSKFLDNGVYSIRAFNDDFILAKRIILEK